MVRSTARTLFPWLAALFALGVLLQAFLAGVALPQLGGNGDFGPHVGIGYTVMGNLALLALIAAGLARADRSLLWESAALFVPYIVQTLLPTMKGSTPFLAALHPVNAVLLFGLAGWLFLQGRRMAPA